MSIDTITLGCRLNFAESETIARQAPADEDWIVVNSCAVTNEAVRQTRQAIRRAHRQRPDAHILVTGCAAELEPQSFASMPGVSRVVSNADKLTSPFVLSEGREAVVEGRSPARTPFDYAPLRSGRTPAVAHDVMPPPPAHRAHPEPVEGRALAFRQAQRERIGEVVPSGFMGHVRSFVAIQTGCDHRCTFCSIWQARGPSRSFRFYAIRDAVVRELDRGASEVVLTGVDITDFEGGLGTLCQRLLHSLPQLRRLRLSSLDSIEIDDVLMELIAGEPRLMPHFHLSLQAGDDLILKRMKRRHSRAEAVRAVERIKAARPDATIGADLIAGFPTETEQMAINTLRLLDDCDVVAAHIFPFSPRPSTPAARMPQVERETVKARAARLRIAAAERRLRWLDGMIGSRQPVLIENHGKGHTDNFAPVAIDGATRGETGQALITGRAGDLLTAVWA